MGIGRTRKSLEYNDVSGVCVPTSSSSCYYSIYKTHTIIPFSLETEEERRCGDNISFSMDDPSFAKSIVLAF